MDDRSIEVAHHAREDRRLVEVRARYPFVGNAPWRPQCRPRRRRERGGRAGRRRRPRRATPPLPRGPAGLGGGSGVELVALCPADDLDRRPKPVQGGPDACAVPSSGSALRRSRSRPRRRRPRTRSKHSTATRVASDSTSTSGIHSSGWPMRTAAAAAAAASSRSPCRAARWANLEVTPMESGSRATERRARSSCSPNGTPSPNTSRYQSMSRATKGRRNGYSVRSFSVRRIPESRMAPCSRGRGSTRRVLRGDHRRAPQTC